MKTNLMFEKKLILFLFLLTVDVSIAGAESFRVKKAHIIKLKDDSEISVKTGINEATSVYLPEDELFINFIDGIELNNNQ